MATRKAKEDLDEYPHRDYGFHQDAEVGHPDQPSTQHAQGDFEFETASAADPDVTDIEPHEYNASDPAVDACDVCGLQRNNEVHP